MSETANATRLRKPLQRRAGTPATATRQGGIATSQKNCLCISDFARARFFLSKRKSQFFWDVLHFGAEWRGCLLLIPPRGMKNELVVILPHQAISPFTHFFILASAQYPRLVITLSSTHSAKLVPAHFKRFVQSTSTSYCACPTHPCAHKSRSQGRRWGERDSLNPQ